MSSAAATTTAAPTTVPSSGPTSSSNSSAATATTFTTKRINRKSTTMISWLNHFSGAMATMGATFVSNPFEVVKTRMQLQGELKKQAAFGKEARSVKTYRNPFHGMMIIYGNEGMRGVQKGIIPALAYQAVMNGTRLGFYQPFKEMLCELEVFKAHPFIASVFAGASSGALGAFIGSPFFLVKTQLQSQSLSSLKTPGKIAVGTQYAHKGMADAFRTIYQRGGIAGLYQGYRAAMTRVAIGSSVQLSSYDAIKRNVLAWGLFEKDSFPVHFFSSFLTGFVVVCFMNPFDVMSTRMYNQKIGPNGKGELYSSMVDCARKIVKHEGPLSFYKGITAHYMRLGPHTLLTFVFWEQLKKIISYAENQ
eukprot:Nk52_evm11s273 gene=Nk52_evmTU11s273